MVLALFIGPRALSRDWKKHCWNNRVDIWSTPEKENK